MGVQFDEDNFGRKTYSNYSVDQSSAGDATGMAKWLINNGLAKDVISANILLIIAALIVFFVSIYFFKYGVALPGSQEAPQVLGPAPILE